MRVRSRLRRKSSERPRLSVFRSGKHIYAQVIDDRQGVTVAAASSIEKDLKGQLKTGADKAAAAAVGKLVAERAAEKGVKIAYGTDAGALPHGNNAIDFARMVDYGMTPLQAVQSATLTAAELAKG